MPMRATTVRFGEDLWALLEREATAQGVSSAQFVRDAAILRLAHLASEREEPDTRLSIERIATGALREERGNGHGDVMAAVRDPARVEAVRAALAASRRPALDRLADVASRVLAAPVSFVTLVDEDRQLFAGCVGLTKEPWAADRATPLTHSFCQHAVAAREPLVVTDAREHPVLKQNLAIRDLDVIAYLGVPLISPEGHALGSFCVIDSKPRLWTTEQVRLMQDLAASVVTELRTPAAA
jgi:GAF domain-containing protein